MAAHVRNKQYSESFKEIQLSLFKTIIMMMLVFVTASSADALEPLKSDFQNTALAASETAATMEQSGNSSTSQPANLTQGDNSGTPNTSQLAAPAQANKNPDKSSTPQAVPPAQGDYWVRTDMKVKVSNPNPPTSTYSYEGQISGREWFRHLCHIRGVIGPGGIERASCEADICYGCDVPPTSIPAGGKVTLGLNYQVRGVNTSTYLSRGRYRHVIPADGIYIYIMDLKAKDPYGVEKLLPASYIGNSNISQNFSGYMPKFETTSKNAEIVFQCPAGTITWIYTWTHY